MKRAANFIYILISGVLAAAPHVAADVISLPAVRDNTLYEDPVGGFSNGAGTSMFAGRNSQAANSRRRAVVAFDVAAAIPAGSTIQAASLTLFNDAANAGPAVVSLHRVTQAWGEGTSSGQGSGAPATPGDATWLHAFSPTSLWSNPGGDFVTDPSGLVTVAGPGAYVWLSTPQLVADVQAELDGSGAALGWLVRGDESVANSAKRFATREATVAGNRPLLTIEFTPVPEPGVLGLAVFLLITVRPRI
jgi:hypothetical protein